MRLASGPRAQGCGWRELDEFVGEAGGRFPALRCGGKSRQGVESRVSSTEYDLAQGGELSVKSTDLVEVAVGPSVEYLCTILNWQSGHGRRIPGQDETAGLGAIQSSTLVPSSLCHGWSTDLSI